MPPDEPVADRIEDFRAVGHPIHTRSLELEVAHDRVDRLHVRGTIIDLRKLGFVPTGGDLQTAGVIHDMSLDAHVEASSATLQRLEPSQAVVPFEANPRTGGESCRDSIGRLRALAGARLDEAFSRRLSDAYGGPLGCSHLLTLAHLLAATVPRAIAWERAARAASPAEREPGERILKRSVVLDGFELDDGKAMDVALQLSDVFTHPFADVERPLDRFARQHEVRVLARVEMAGMRLSSIAARERVREGAHLEAGGWESRDEVVAAFVGGPAVAGLTRLVRERLGDLPGLETLRVTLQNLAPGLIQCLAASAHRMVEGGVAEGEGPAILQFGGLPDSCYVWRAGGPGMRLRDAARRDYE